MHSVSARPAMAPLYRGVAFFACVAGVLAAPLVGDRPEGDPAAAAIQATSAARKAPVPVMSSQQMAPGRPVSRVRSGWEIELKPTRAPAIPMIIKPTRRYTAEIQVASR